MNSQIPALRRLIACRRSVAALGLAVFLSVSTAVADLIVAAPTSHGPSVSLPSAQNVDYISAGAGAALDLGFPVLVPSWVPAPFGGEPAVDAGGGSYSLYWMNGGGEPTFLQITGVVGGGLPAGSPYDLNIELSINASVNGFDAIHDVTPIYDAVWWIQGGVLYSVQSRNMTGTDSLGLAQSLVQFVAPAAPEPTSPPPPTQAPPPAGEAENPGGNQAADTADPDTTDTLEESTSDGSEESLSEQANESGQSGSSDQVTSGASTEKESAPLGSDGTGMPSVASDGTGGPPVEVVGTDGTGGRDVIVVPRRAPVLEPTP